MVSRMKQVKYHDLALTLLLMILSTAIAFLFFYLGKTNSPNIAILYILALILTAMYTKGYAYGIFFALVSVILMNYCFTYPYFRLNFTLTGYPVTFLGMLSIALLTSATTTHMKNQAKQLSEQTELVNKAEKEAMRANLLRAISHDLRTPLTSIIGASNSYFELKGKSSKQEQEEFVRQINDDATWLLHIVENLLTVTRIEEDGANLTTSQEVVEEVVSEAIVRFQKRNPAAKVNVLLPKDYIVLPIDPLLIEQVLINLLENAYVHSHSTKATYVIIKETKDQVYFCVRDYGKGIDPKKLEFLFQDRTTNPSLPTDGYKGSGIGLSICKTIIEAHHGTILARNHEKGAEVIFTLPKGEASHEHEVTSITS